MMKAFILVALTGLRAVAVIGKEISVKPSIAGKISASLEEQNKMLAFTEEKLETVENAFQQLMHYGGNVAFNKPSIAGVPNLPDVASSMKLLSLSAPQPVAAQLASEPINIATFLNGLLFPTGLKALQACPLALNVRDKVEECTGGLLQGKSQTFASRAGSLRSRLNSEVARKRALQKTTTALEEIAEGYIHDHIHVPVPHVHVPTPKLCTGAEYTLKEVDGLCDAIQIDQLTLAGDLAAGGALSGMISTIAGKSISVGFYANAFASLVKAQTSGKAIVTDLKIHLEATLIPCPTSRLPVKIALSDVTLTVDEPTIAVQFDSIPGFLNGILSKVTNSIKSLVWTTLRGAIVDAIKNAINAQLACPSP